MYKAEMTIPHLFRCPISLDLFEDPVTLCTGQTYDRSSIEKWLSAGNLTCPVTMQRLHDPTIIPNHTLRQLIHQWLELGPRFDPGSSATLDSLAALKHTLESQDATLENKLQALEKFKVLSDEFCSFRKSCFLELGFLSAFLELVFGRIEAQVTKDDMEFTELALSCILKLLPLGDFEPLNMIKDKSKLATFILLFEQGTNLVKTSLCHLIESAAASEITQELCCVLGNSHKLVQEIVQVVQRNCEFSEDAVKAISALCTLQSNREILVREGAIDGIMKYISPGYERRHKNLAPLAILEKLLELEIGREALVNHPNGIETLVNMVFRVSDQECSESVVEILLIVCGDCVHAREKAIDAGVMTRLLLLMQSHCGTTTKSKARMLLKLLKSKWINEPK